MTDEPSGPSVVVPRLYHEHLAPHLDTARDRWREDRLHIGLLPPAARRWALLGLGIAVVSAGFIIVLGEGWRIPGGALLYTTRGEAGVRIPLALIVFLYLGFASVGGVVMVAARHDGWKLPAIARLFVAGVGAAIAADSITAADSMQSLSGANPGVIKILGWSGVALSCVIALLPRRALGRRHELAALIGGSPFLLALAAYAFTGSGRDGVLARNFLGSEMIGSLLGLSIAVALLLVWGVAESVRLGCDYGHVLATVSRAAPWLFPALLTAKVVWIIAAYDGWLPGWLGGGNSSWVLSSQDGLVGWGYAIVIVVLGALWLHSSRRRRAPSTRTLDSWLALVAVGLGCTYLAYAILGLLIDITLPWPWLSIPANIAAAANHLVPPDLAKSWPAVVTVAVSPLLALALTPRHRWHPASVFLLVFAVWGAPSAAYTAWGLVTHNLPPFNNTSLATIDTVVTAAIVVFAILWWTGRQRQVSPHAMLVALTAFTLIGHPGVLLPANWRGGSLVYLALIYPVVWKFLFRARALNGHAPDRPARVLGAIGLSSLLLMIATVSVAIGLTAPGRSSELNHYLDLVGQVFLMVPFAAVLVAEIVAGEKTETHPVAHVLAHEPSSA